LVPRGHIRGSLVRDFPARATESRELTASGEENGRRLALYRRKETKRSGSGRYLSIARDGDARRRRQCATRQQKLRKRITIGLSNSDSRPGLISSFSFRFIIDKRRKS